VTYPLLGVLRCCRSKDDECWLCGNLDVVASGFVVDSATMASVCVWTQKRTCRSACDCDGISERLPCHIADCLLGQRLQATISCIRHVLQLHQGNKLTVFVVSLVLSVSTGWHVLRTSRSNADPSSVRCLCDTASENYRAPMITLSAHHLLSTNALFEQKYQNIVTEPAHLAETSSSGEELASPCLPRNTLCVITGNNRTKKSLVGQHAVVKRSVGLGGWHHCVGSDGMKQRNARDKRACVGACLEIELVRPCRCCKMAQKSSCRCDTCEVTPAVACVFSLCLLALTVGHCRMSARVCRGMHSLCWRWGPQSWATTHQARLPTPRPASPTLVRYECGSYTMASLSGFPSLSIRTSCSADVDGAK